MSITEPVIVGAPKAENASIIAAMDQAWRDHFHARDQTWKALQIEATLAAGMIGIDLQLDNSTATLGAGLLTIVAAILGAAISFHHRKVEIRKFTHILNCEEALGLHTPNLISGVSLPQPIKIWDIFLPWKLNTALFIVRMHVTIMIFAILYIVFS